MPRNPNFPRAQSDKAHEMRNAMIVEEYLRDHSPIRDLAEKYRVTMLVVRKVLYLHFVTELRALGYEPEGCRNLEWLENMLQAKGDPKRALAAWGQK